MKSYVHEVSKDIHKIICELAKDGFEVHPVYHSSFDGNKEHNQYEEWMEYNIFKENVMDAVFDDASLKLWYNGYIIGRDNSGRI